MTQIFLTIGLVGAVIWLWGRFLALPETPLRHPPKLTTISVFCGNCANRWDPDSRLPRAPLTRTLLTTAGVCSGCGGRSYVLASMYAPIIRDTIRYKFAAEHDPMPYSDAPREEWKEKRL